MVFPIILLAPLFGTSLATTIPHLLIRDTISSNCSTTGVASCQTTTTPTNTCCNEYPGGQLVQAQFWDTDVAGSPADSWTIHGLWANDCDGSYLNDCDPSRADVDLAELLADQGATVTLDYMRQYWLNDDGTNGELWDHEWGKHGTCFSTLEPSCLPSGSPKGADAVAYCEATVSLFKTLPTYTWLADAGITPSSSETYALSDILSALETGSGGYTPDLGCSDGELTSISWYFNLEGSAIDGTYVPINSPDSSSCSSDVQYLPKSG